MWPGIVLNSWECMYQILIKTTSWGRNYYYDLHFKKKKMETKSVNHLPKDTQVVSGKAQS